jgi:hypothetical protein
MNMIDASLTTLFVGRRVDQRPGKHCLTRHEPGWPGLLPVRATYSHAAFTTGYQVKYASMVWNRSSESA